MTAVAFDVETTGLDPYRGAQIFAYSTCDEEGNVEVVRKDRNGTARFYTRLQKLIGDASIEKVAHNFHFELAMLQVEGIYVPPETVWHDTMIMHQLMDNLSPQHSLDYIAERYLPDYPKEWREADANIQKAKRIYGTYDKMPESIMTPYQEADAERTMLLYKSFSEHFVWDEDYANELDLVKETIEMEKHGIMVCRGESLKLMEELKQKLSVVSTNIYRIFGEHLNFNSDKVVSNVLFNRLKLPVLYKTKSGAPSTDKDTLEELRNHADSPGVAEVLDLILQQRSYTHGTSIITSYLSLCVKGDILHPHINTNEADTGREASSNPNLQNVQKEKSLRTRFGVPARRCFRARPGYVLFFADYAGIEMRLIVEVTGEPELMELVQKNGDPHALAASLFYGQIWENDAEAIKFAILNDDSQRKEYRKDVDKLGREEALKVWGKKARKLLRTAAKNSQFALAYGAGMAKIADTLGLSLEAFKPGYYAYCQRFPRVARYAKRMAGEVKSKGYVYTPFFRKLRIRADKPFSAANYMIQGTAAGILKRAQVRVSRYLREELNNEVRMLLPIHDEIVFEYPRHLLSERKRILSDIGQLMTTHRQIQVPLDIEWKMSTYLWSQAKEVQS